jgi:hypothetical protein
MTWRGMFGCGQVWRGRAVKAMLGLGRCCMVWSGIAVEVRSGKVRSGRVWSGRAVEVRHGEAAVKVGCVWARLGWIWRSGSGVVG